MYILFLYFRSSTIFIANVDAKTTPMDLWIASVPQGWSSLKTVAGELEKCAHICLFLLYLLEGRLITLELIEIS